MDAVAFLPDLTARMAEIKAVLTRGLAANLALNSWRQLGHAFLLALATKSWKHLRQKLCWQGAYTCGKKKKEKKMSKWNVCIEKKKRRGKRGEREKTRFKNVQ